MDQPEPVLVNDQPIFQNVDKSAKPGDVDGDLLADIIEVEDRESWPCCELYEKERGDEEEKVGDTVTKFFRHFYKVSA
jgi:hypothetical protein